MTRYLAVFVLLVLLITISTVKAYPYTNINISDTLTQSGNTVLNNVSYNLQFFNISNNVVIPIPSSATIVNVLNNGHPVSFNKTYNSQYTLISLMNLYNGSKLTINYNFPENVQYNNSMYTFSYPFTPPMFCRSVELEVTLPFSAYIPNNVSSLFSPPVYSFSSNGRNVQVIWIISNQTFFDHNYIIIPFSLQYKLLYMQQPTSLTSDTYIYIAALIILMAVFVALYLILRHKQSRPVKRTNRHNQFISILSEDEKKVLEIVRRREKIYQHEVVEATGFSKAKVSKIVGKLINYKLIKSKPIGKFNELRPNK